MFFVSVKQMASLSALMGFWWDHFQGETGEAILGAWLGVLTDDGRYLFNSFSEFCARVPKHDVPIFFLKFLYRGTLSGLLTNYTCEFCHMLNIAFFDGVFRKENHEFVFTLYVVTATTSACASRTKGVANHHTICSSKHLGRKFRISLIMYCSPILLQLNK